MIEGDGTFKFASRNAYGKETQLYVLHFVSSDSHASAAFAFFLMKRRTAAAYRSAFKLVSYSYELLISVLMEALDDEDKEALRAATWLFDAEAAALKICKEVSSVPHSPAMIQIVDPRAIKVCLVHYLRNVARHARSLPTEAEQWMHDVRALPFLPQALVASRLEALEAT